MAVAAAGLLDKLRAIDGAAIDISRLAINASVETMRAAGFLDDFERVIAENLIVEANLLDVCTEGGRADKLPRLCADCGIEGVVLANADGIAIATSGLGRAGEQIPAVLAKAEPGRPMRPRAIPQQDGMMLKVISAARQEGGYIIAVKRFFPPAGRLTINSFGVVARQVKEQADLIRQHAATANAQGRRLEELAEENDAAKLRGCLREVETALGGIERTARLVGLLGVRAAIEAAQSTNDKQEFDQLLSEHMTIQARLTAEIFVDARTHAQAEKIMRRVGLDEVWITDGMGKVVLSNVPDGEGFVFTRQGQTAPYMRILDFPDTVVTAPPSVRPFDGKVFKFVGVGRRGVKGILQVGRETQIYGQSTAEGFEIVSRDIKRMAADLQTSVAQAREGCVST